MTSCHQWLFSLCLGAGKPGGLFRLSLLCSRTSWQVPNSEERQGSALRKTHSLQGRIKDNKYTSWRSFTQVVLFLAVSPSGRVIIPPCSDCVQQLFSVNLFCLSSDKLEHLSVCVRVCVFWVLTRFVPRSWVTEPLSRCTVSRCGVEYFPPTPRLILFSTQRLKKPFYCNK